ncbi:zinc metalloproteinase-disintegrin-like 4a [Oculina patagonica]
MDFHPSEEVFGKRSGIRPNISNVDDVYKPYLTTNKTRYNELLLVADYKMYLKYNKNKKVVEDRVITVANAVDAIYQRINIRVVLKALEIWTNGDPYERTGQAELSRFNRYRIKHLRKQFPHDNAHLLSQKWWPGARGKAYITSTCNWYYSCGIIRWKSGLMGPYIGLAHEMGHNFGFQEDRKKRKNGEICRCLTPERGCIMGAGGPKKRIPGFSDCNMKSLKRLKDWCLYNVPTYKSYNSYCGNGIREEGEECDCGTPEMCMVKDPCCEPYNCVRKESCPQ